MFTGYFFHLRRRGLNVSVQEFMALLVGLKLGLAGESLLGFYGLARSLLVKSEAHFDLFDQCFAEYFQGVEVAPQVKDELHEWLKNAPLPRPLDPEEMERLKHLDLEELRRQFEERMAQQHERHDGGNRWVGTGGTSPFGHSGRHPTGVRVHGESLWKSAVQVAAERRYRNLRSDVVLDTRQISLALKKLRRLARESAHEEIDVEETIRATARNAGEIELVMRAERKNSVKLLLLMDVGGSMTAHTRVSEQLFSAAHSLNHFKEFRHYYFHNCVYDFLFKDIGRLETIGTADLLHELGDDWHLIVVGDAAMSPYELTAPGGCIDYFHHNEEPGLVWLDRLRKRVPRSVWLNPESVPMWQMPSAQLVRRVFKDMFPLTIAGLEEAIAHLRPLR
jgi:uncharacterized protein with von Willebrand factor type A (vWA) domain